MERLNITFVRVCVDRVLCVSFLVYKTNKQLIIIVAVSMCAVAIVRVHSVHAMNSAVSTNP